MNELRIDEAVLDYKDCAETQNELFNKLIRFIELKAHQTRKDRIEVINACDYCGHILNMKQHFI